MSGYMFTVEMPYTGKTVVCDNMEAYKRLREWARWVEEEQAQRKERRVLDERYGRRTPRH
jgi:hypothetical protein